VAQAGPQSADSGRPGDGRAKMKPVWYEEQRSQRAAGSRCRL